MKDAGDDAYTKNVKALVALLRRGGPHVGALILNGRSPNAGLVAGDVDVVSWHG